MDKWAREIIEAVNKINEDIQKQISADEYVLCTMTFAGWAGYIVKFCNFIIWASEEDEREYIVQDGQEEFEPLEQYLRKEINKFADMVSKVKM